MEIVFQHLRKKLFDFVAVELLDKQVIGHAYDFLKEKYPYLLQITYQSLEKLKTNQNLYINQHQ